LTGDELEHARFCCFRGEPCSRRYDPRVEPGSAPDRKLYVGTGIGVLYGQFKHDRHGKRHSRLNRTLRKGGKLQPKSGEQHLWLLAGWTIVGLNELKGNE
jgi:hypothetical protein